MDYVFGGAIIKLCHMSVLVLESLSVHTVLVQAEVQLANLLQFSR
jgi:hypothetical protein